MAAWSDPEPGDKVTTFICDACHQGIQVVGDKPNKGFLIWSPNTGQRWACKGNCASKVLGATWFEEEGGE